MKGQTITVVEPALVRIGEDATIRQPLSQFPDDLRFRQLCSFNRIRFLLLCPEVQRSGCKQLLAPLFIDSKMEDWERGVR